jgi:hypothetical protein
MKRSLPRPRESLRIKRCKLHRFSFDLFPLWFCLFHTWNNCFKTAQTSYSFWCKMQRQSKRRDNKSGNQSKIPNPIMDKSWSPLQNVEIDRTNVYEWLVMLTSPYGLSRHPNIYTLVFTVWPYTKPVQLYPWSAACTSGCAVAAYTSACVKSMPKKRSNVNVYALSKLPTRTVVPLLIITEHLQCAAARKINQVDTVGSLLQKRTHTVDLVDLSRCVVSGCNSQSAYHIFVSGAVWRGQIVFILFYFKYNLDEQQPNRQFSCCSSKLAFRPVTFRFGTVLQFLAPTHRVTYFYLLYRINPRIPY